MGHFRNEKYPQFELYVSYEDCREGVVFGVRAKRLGFFET